MELEKCRFKGAEIVRLHHGWRHKDFTYKIFRNDSTCYYQEMQRGGHDMSWSHVSLMAAKLGVSIEYLVLGGAWESRKSGTVLKQAQIAKDLNLAIKYTTRQSKEKGGPISKYKALLWLATKGWSTDVDLPSECQPPCKSGPKKSKIVKYRRPRWGGVKL